MNMIINKQELQKKLLIASRFCSYKSTSTKSLQGGMLKFFDNFLEITTTNLKDFFNTRLKTDSINLKKETKMIVDIKKIIEFLNLISDENIEIEIKENALIIKNKKTKGFFNFVIDEGFPKMPKIEGKKHIFKKDFFEKKTPLITFASAKDENRPILTGVNISDKNGELCFAATDGFRLSVVNEKRTKDIPIMTVSAEILDEIKKIIQENKEIEEVETIFSTKEKIIVFNLINATIISKLIDGDFPPFEKVIPKEHTTKFISTKEDFLKNIRLAAIFARDFSNVVVFEFKKDGLYLKPKNKNNEESIIYQEGTLEGDELIISFNYKFVLDFLNNVDGKEIIFEATTSNAPAVFKTDNYPDLTHVVMPIRSDETV